MSGCQRRSRKVSALAGILRMLLVKEGDHRPVLRMGPEVHSVEGVPVLEDRDAAVAGPPAHHDLAGVEDHAVQDVTGAADAGRVCFAEDGETLWVRCPWSSFKLERGAEAFADAVVGQHLRVMVGPVLTPDLEEHRCRCRRDQMDGGVLPIISLKFAQQPLVDLRKVLELRSGHQPVGISVRSGPEAVLLSAPQPCFSMTVAAAWQHGNTPLVFMSSSFRGDLALRSGSLQPVHDPAGPSGQRLDAQP